MKATLKILSCLTLMISLQARAQEDRMIANLDITDIKKEFVKVTPEEVQTVSGIVQQSEEETEVSGVNDETADGE